MPAPDVTRPLTPEEVIEALELVLERERASIGRAEETGDFWAAFAHATCADALATTLNRLEEDLEGARRWEEVRRRREAKDHDIVALVNS